MRLPRWVDDACPPGRLYPTIDERMDLVIELARRNIAEETGGPFGAGVFNPDDGKLIAAGVNMVVPLQAAILHAESVAFALAGQVLGTFELAGMELVTSTEPCAMCLGAVPWAGIGRLVCGARHEDAAAVGFDEGDKPPHWEEGLAARGIEVVQDVRRHQATAVLEAYALVTHGSHGHHDAELGTFLHRDEQIARARHRVRDMIRDLLADAARTGRVRDDVTPAELA
ncbi:MAG: nucleoside deaminase, partial [Acidimicrobiia bacterium]|nr:nucleoside deaminase [Acidimicrobiia bacterium]